MSERTYVMLKPDAVRRGFAGRILQRFEDAGLQMAAMQRLAVSEAQSKALYAEHEGKPFYDSLLTYIHSGPVVATVWEGTGAVALALVLWRGSWPRVRLLVTVVHEAGHALVALLVGRRLQGIRLHSDTSGVTVSRGRPTGPGMVVMLAAGYLAPAVLGLGAALLLADGRALLLLWSLSLLLLLVLLWIRNGFGLLVVVVVLAGTVAVTWYADARTQSALALLLAWLLLLAAPRPLVELLVGGRAGRRGSDPDQLARLTRIPSVLWTLLLLAASVSGLVVGVSTLAPDLLAR